MNDAVFMGRRDSIAAPYLLTSLGYYDSSGFFGDVSVSYLTGENGNRVDLFLLSSGYLFSGEKWKGGISGTAYFFNEDSYNVRSETFGNLSGFLGYDLKFIEVSTLLSTYFTDGGGTDVFGGLILHRTFANQNSTWVFNPALALYGGSQYFYEAYYNTSRLGNRKGGQGQGTGGSGSTATGSIQITEASKFKVLNLEISLPVFHQHKQFIFSFEPALAFPQGSSTITTDDAVITEELEPVFYFSAGISYVFRTGKNNK